LFFVISGFLITSILLASRGGSGYFRNFYARRFLRIFPLFYAVLFLRFMVWPALGMPLPPVLAASSHLFWLFGSNFVPTLTEPDPIEVAWLLAVEEQFYLVWPLLIFGLPTRWVPGLLVGVLALGVGLRAQAVLGGVSPEVIYHATYYRLDGLAVGALLATIVRDPRRAVRLRA